MPQRQEYKKYERDLKNIMKRSNRHPRRKFQRLNRGETIFEEIMPKNFPEQQQKDLNSQILKIMCFHYLQSGELQ